MVAYVNKTQDCHILLNLLCHQTMLCCGKKSLAIFLFPPTTQYIILSSQTYYLCASAISDTTPTCIPRGFCMHTQHFANFSSLVLHWFGLECHRNSPALSSFSGCMRCSCKTRIENSCMHTERTLHSFGSYPMSKMRKKT